MSLIKFLFIFLLIFFKIKDINSFDIFTNLYLNESVNFKNINKIENHKFVDFLNNKDIKEKHFIISHSKINSDLDSSLKIRFPDSDSRFTFNKDANASQCETSGLIDIGEIKQGNFIDEILLRSSFTDLNFFYKVKDNVILKTKSRYLKHDNAFNLYIRDVNLIDFIQFINLIEDDKTNSVSSLLHGIQNFSDTYINNEKYYVVNVNVLNINKKSSFSADHVNIFIDLSFLPLINNIDFIEFIQSDCIYPVSNNENNAYFVFYQNFIEDVNEIKCENCIYDIYQVEYESGNSKSSYEINSKLYFEKFLKNNDDEYYFKIINNKFYIDFLRNLNNKNIYSNSILYKEIPIKEIEIINKDSFQIKSNNELISFELRDSKDFENHGSAYIYYEDKLIQKEYFIENYLCSFFLFSSKDDFKNIDKFILDNNFFNLLPYESKIENNILNCSYDLKFKDYTNSTDKLDIKSFYFQYNNFLDPNFIIHIKNNENLIKLLNNINYNTKSKTGNYFSIKILFILADLLMILMIIILYKYKYFKINRIFLLISLFIFFLLILLSPNTEHLIASYFLYYFSTYLFFVSLIVSVLFLKKSN